jgi:hypothetical protein
MLMKIDRDLADLLKKSHLSPHKYTPDTPMDTIFASNASCVLSPEVTEGPYCKPGIRSLKECES